MAMEPQTGLLRRLIAPKADVPAVLKSDQLPIIKPTRVVRPVLPVAKTPTELPLPSGSQACTFSADWGISEKSTKSPSYPWRAGSWLRDTQYRSPCLQAQFRLTQTPASRGRCSFGLIPTPKARV